MKRLVMCLACILLESFTWSGVALAAVVNANSCSDTDVQSAINAASNGDLVSIPAGSCTWTSTVNNTKQITLQGAGMDITTINCGSLASCISMNVPGGAAKPLWRITGFTFTGGAYYAGLINIHGAGQNWRIDNNKFYDWGISENPHAIQVQNGAPGVINNNIFYTTHNGSAAINVWGEVVLGEKGNATWLIPYTWGTTDAVFVENNTFTFHPNQPTTTGYGWATDGYAGARYVIRYNTILNGAVTWHGVDSNGSRGGIGGEVYNNTWTTDKSRSNSIGRAMSTRSGVLAFHDNVIQGYIVPVASYPYRAEPPDQNGLCGNSWPCGNGTEWWMCSNSPFMQCNPTIPADPGSALVGDAYCASRAAGSCSKKFCSGNRDIICTGDADCAGAGTCSAYFDGSGTNPPGYPFRDQPGIGPGGQVAQPQMSWGNKFCDSGPTCTPVDTITIIYGSGTNSSMQAGRDFHNCTNQLDCQTKAGTIYRTAPYPYNFNTPGRVPGRTNLRQQ